MRLRTAITLVSLVAVTGPAAAATVHNADSEPRTIVVSQNGAQMEILLAPGESRQFCANGCFVRMPNGDREALTGAEILDIEDGRAVFH